jgi:hypothetical protein
MREFTELLVLSDHACSNPRLERLEVYEPIRMEALWLSIFRCCAQVFSEPSGRTETLPVLHALPARGEAA